MEELKLPEWNKIKDVHFIGIGGISMSGLAEIMISLGYIVSGSDISQSNITEKLRSNGILITYGHSADNIKNTCDLAVYTAAVKENNPELIKARSLNIPVIERAVLLGEIMRKYPYSIAVSGTHGKTTTTSMVSLIMLEAKLNPTIHIGGELDAIGGNTKVGKGNYFITEACEYVDSFLKFHPYLAIILNIEADHLDYFKNIQHIKDSFYKFASLIPSNGYAIVCADDINTDYIRKNLSCNVVTYGIDSQDATWKARNITFNNSGYPSFIVTMDDKPVANITLSVPGIHNVSNALAAIASCRSLGCSMDQIREGLLKFHGTYRRFEFKGEFNGIKVIDDYAHHPSEILATLNAAKNFPYSKLWCIFQPHTYTRTKSLLNDFATSFKDADEVLIADIYAAREVNTHDIHSSILSEKISSTGKKSTYFSEFDSIAEYVRNNASAGDIIITMGAGDIYKVGEMLLDNSHGEH